MLSKKGVIDASQASGIPAAMMRRESLLCWLVGQLTRKTGKAHSVEVRMSGKPVSGDPVVSSEATADAPDSRAIVTA